MTTGQRPSTVKVVVATTVMLSFISFWRAAAIVLSDMASSAYYVGGIAETAMGKSAPWFILAIMLFAYAVRAIYIESCSMFVRGGVYKVVHEAMGGTLAKFSVSALMFDYVLTGPISGVSAGLYLGGLINEIGASMHLASMHVYPPYFAAAFAAAVTIYFWWQNTIGIHESSEKALRIMQVTSVMVVILISWCIATIATKGYQPVPLPTLQTLHFNNDALGWLRGTVLPSFTGIAIMIGLGHSLLAMSGFETLAQVYREIAHPKLKNLERAGTVINLYALVFTSLVSFFAVMIIPDGARKGFLDNLIGGLSMYLIGPLPLKLAVPRLRGTGGHADPGGRGEYGDHRLQRSTQPRGRGRGAARLVPAPAPQVRHHLAADQHDRAAATSYDRGYHGGHDAARGGLRVWRGVELLDEGVERAGAAL